MSKTNRSKSNRGTPLLVRGKHREHWCSAPGDPFLAPFFETAIEHVWGGVWNRPGLELKYRSLVVVSVLAAIGQNEELKTHLRGALNLGWTADELREALLQISGYAGFPAAHEALRVLSEIVTQR